MHPLRAALLTALLGLLALLIAWGLRSPRRADPGLDGAARAGEPLVKPVAAPKRDFPRRPAAQDEVFAEPADDETPGPEHPWTAYLKRCAEIESKLRAAKPDLDFTDSPLEPILAVIEEATGLRFHLDCPQETTAKRISFAVKDLMAMHTLRLLLQQYDLLYVVSEDGEAWIIPAKPFPDGGPRVHPHEPAWMGDYRALKMVSAEATAKPKDTGEAERNRVTLSAIKSIKVSLNLTETSLPDAISNLQEACQLNFMIDRRCVDDPEVQTVTATLVDVPVEQALGACLHNTELGWYAKDGVLVVTTLEAIKTIEDATELDRKIRAERAAAERDLFAQSVAFGAENIRLRDLAEVLAKGLGVPWQMDPATWARKARYTVEERQRPASEIVRLMRKGAPLIVTYRNGILWFLSPEGMK